MNPFVLVGGWPGSGKTTLARALARELGIAYLSKDEVKETLMDRLGAPPTVEESRALGVTAVHVVLGVALGCPGAVVDSTWFGYTAPLVARLPGPVVEVRCLADRDVVRRRFAERVRDARHLDDQRSEDELWGSPVEPLGAAALLEVDTTSPVDVAVLAQAVRRAAARGGPANPPP